MWNVDVEVLSLTRGVSPMVLGFLQKSSLEKGRPSTPHTCQINSKKHAHSFLRMPLRFEGTNLMVSYPLPFGDMCPHTPQQPLAQRWSNRSMQAFANWRRLSDQTPVSRRTVTQEPWTWRSVAIYKPSLKLTNKSHLRMDGWEMSFLLGQMAYSQVRPVSFREGICFIFFACHGYCGHHMSLSLQIITQYIILVCKYHKCKIYMYK